MIYTSFYFEPRIKGMYKVKISKTQPKGITVDHYSQILEPGAEILWGYKAGTVSEQNYTRRYLDYLNKNKDNILREIAGIKRKAHENGQKDIVLLCWCRKGNFCHRRLLANWLHENGNEIIEEL